MSSDIVIIIFFIYLLVSAGVTGFWIGYVKGRYDR